ncbi:hypothetical protein F-S17_0374 [Faustovirus]|nr:hypothetical protein F-LCD7_0378 [Faustovirus]QJX72640.1 hypothetical protein F-S17_0374 [Faustovirus]
MSVMNCESENIYPVEYSCDKVTVAAPSAPKDVDTSARDRAWLNLDIDNIDALATRWLANKFYAVVECVTDVAYHTGIVATFGCAGLSLRYLFATFNMITDNCNLWRRHLRYYSRAHMDCGNDNVLDYYRSEEVDDAFKYMRATLHRSGMFLAVAGALVAVSFGAKRLYRYAHKRRAAVQNKL